MTGPLTALLLAAVLCVGPTCGGAPASRGDAATEGGVTGSDECKLVAQDCPAGMLCRPVCAADGVVSLKCEADSGGTGVHGETCSGMSCMKGSRCVGHVAADGGLIQTCVKFCDTQVDCPAGKSCNPYTLLCPPSSRQLRACDY
jgi:hypothetical protein